MNRFGFLAALSALGLGTLVGASGCEVQACEDEEGNSAVCLKSLERFDGADVEPAPLAYTAGMDLTVNGNYGDIDIVEGTTGEVSVVFEPFNYRAHDADAEARDELENNFDYSFEVSGNAIVATTGRHDATNGLGADVTVFLPPEFDGVLTLTNDSDGAVNPGDVQVVFVGRAKAVDVSTDSLGDCNVEGAESVVSTRVHCDGTIHVGAMSDHADIASTGLGGEVLVTMGHVTGDGAGGTITSEDGDVRVNFPPGADFTVQAQATADGTVEASRLDDACQSEVAAENSKSYTCGAGGPNFVVNAGTDGVGPSSVTLTY